MSTRRDSDDDDNSLVKKCTKQMFIGVGLFIIGAVLFAISVSAVLEYNKWKDAVYGQCKFNSSIAIECRGSRNCHGWTLGHEYVVSNETDAFASCSQVVYHKDEDSCVCNAAEVSDYSLPSTADGEYHDCYVKSCDTVHFEAPSTKSQYASSASMFAVGVVLLCGSFAFCAYGRKRKVLEDESVSKIEVEQQQAEGDGPKRRSSGTGMSGVTVTSATNATATTRTQTATSTAPSMVTVKSESTLDAVPETAAGVEVTGAEQSVAL